jgi:hypothetical protein
MMRASLLLTAIFGLYVWALPVKGMKSNPLTDVDRLLTPDEDAKDGILSRHDNDEQIRYPDRDEDITYPDAGLYAESG